MNIDDLTRLEILLADQATGDLDRDGHRELSDLLNEEAAMDESLDFAAAALHAALLPEEEGMPASLRESLASMAPVFVDSVAETKPQPALELVSNTATGPGGSGSKAWLGWLAAAACLVFALWALSKNRVAPLLDSGTQRAKFLETGDMVQSINWQATEDPSAVGAYGDVVWSNAEQKGYMRFSGLKANNPESVQYQLWIFDEDRENPVDGGVFDIPAGTDEVIIPIDAKLNVGQPTLFAITVEKPGGVVVSKRERIVLVADPTKAG